MLICFEKYSYNTLNTIIKYFEYIKLIFFKVIDLYVRISVKNTKKKNGRLEIFFDDYIKNYNRYSSKKYFLLFIFINYLIYLNLFFISVDVLKENRKYKIS